MNDEEFAQYIDRVMAEMETRQQRLEDVYRLSSWARWQLDPVTYKLRFGNEQGQNMVDADTVFVGSYSTKAGTWKWGWSNFDLRPEDRAKSEKIRELTPLTGYGVFENGDQMEIDEYTAFNLTAMALDHLQADGFFRVPNRDPQTSFFLGLLNVRRHHTDQWALL